MDTNKDKSSCYHCGDVCEEGLINFDDKSFCCNGCKTVYQIFTDNDLDQYYELQQNPGITPTFISNKYNFLDKEDIVSRLLEFDNGKFQIITLFIPTVHCSSCIWVLRI